MHNPWAQAAVWASTLLFGWYYLRVWAWHVGKTSVIANGALTFRDFPAAFPHMAWRFAMQLWRSRYVGRARPPIQNVPRATLEALFPALQGRADCELCEITPYGAPQTEQELADELALPVEVVHRLIEWANCARGAALEPPPHV
jgi:hypothetical protein